LLAPSKSPLVISNRVPSAETINERASRFLTDSSSSSDS